MFVSFEGGEGSGKSTVLKVIENEFEKRGVLFISTREPGGIPIAEEIRSVILNPSNTDMDDRTEATLFAASRRQHLVQRVIPAINEGKIVLCDRFIDSSLAYQGYAKGIGINEILKLNEFVIEGYMPDVTFYLDLEPEIGIERIRANKSREINRLDMEKIDFHQKVREGYREVMNLFPNRIYQINANQPIEKVFKDIMVILEEKILEKN